MYLCRTIQHLLAQMSLKLHFRVATLNDLPTLLNFEQQLIAVERPMDSSLKQTEPTYYYNLPQLLQSPKAYVLLALHEQQIIGCGYGKIVESTPKYTEALHGYIGFMFVLPNYRGQNVGGQIIEQLKLWFVSQQIKEVILEVYEQNPNAIKAYKKVGFEPVMVMMRCVL